MYSRGTQNIEQLEVSISYVVACIRTLDVKCLHDHYTDRSTCSFRLISPKTNIEFPRTNPTYSDSQ